MMRPSHPLAKSTLSWIRLALSAALVSTQTQMALAESFSLPGAGDDLIGRIRHTKAHQEDTLIDIARRFSIGQDEMVMANPTVDRWLPKEGTDVLIPQLFILPDAPRAGIVVNIPEMRLYYFPVRASAAKKAPVAAATGKTSSITCKKPADKPASPAKPASAGNGNPGGKTAGAGSAKTSAKPTQAPNTKSAAKPCVATPAPRPAPAPVAAASYESAGSGEVISYPVSMGRMDWRTPIGKTTVVNKQKDPSWTPPASIKREHAAKGDPLPDVVPPGPDNPLGKFAMRLGVSGYLIHGTDVAKADGIGMRVTHGCMRLYNEDIAKLFPLVPVGSPVYLVNQPIKLGWRGSLLYLEASQPLDEDTGIPNHDPDENVSKEQLRREDEQRSRFLMRIANTEIQKMKDKTGASVDMDKVRRYLDKPTGIPVVIGGSGSGWQAAASDEGMAPAKQEDDPNLVAPGLKPGSRKPTAVIPPRPRSIAPAPARSESSATGEAEPVRATPRAYDEESISEPVVSRPSSDEFYTPDNPYRPAREASASPVDMEDRPADARSSPYPSPETVEPTSTEPEEE
ncbi:MAG: L,D-transpeptidase family protein [Methylococcus sp.]